MQPQRYTAEERELFEQEVAQALRAEVSSMREEEIKTAARRAAMRELEQQREVLREDLDDQVVAITEEPDDLRAIANREAPSKVLLGIVLLLLLLFTLAVFNRLPWLTRASASGDQGAVPADNESFNSILGAPAAPPSQPSPLVSVPPSPSPLVSPSPSPVQVAILPHTGVDDSAVNEYFIHPLFGRFYWDHGGSQRFGRPTSPLLVIDGRQLQMFEHAQFEYRPEYAGTPEEVQVVPLP